MSIITDALKKAQKGQTPQTETDNKSVKQPVFGPRAEYRANIKENKKFGGRKNNFLTGGVVFAVLLIVSLTLIFGYMQNMQAVFLKQTNSLGGANQKTLSSNSQLVQPPDEKPPFKLSGIVQDENKPLAVINDIIVSAGETVNDAKVASINDDSVILNYKGRKITLYLAN